MFLQASVILSTGGREGVCLSACWDASPPPPRSRHPPGADTPQADTPPRGQTPPPQPGTPPPPPGPGTPLR